MSVAVPARAPARGRAAAAQPREVRQTRPRRRRVTAGGLVWVALLAALMFGIVAVNVAALRGSIDVNKMRAQVQQLEEQNRALRARGIDLSNPAAIGQQAKKLGMVQADAIHTRHVRLPGASDGRQPGP